MNSNQTVPKGLRSEEIIGDLDLLVETQKAEAFRIEGLYGGKFELQKVGRIDLTHPHFIKASNGARYFFEHNTWAGTHSSSGSRSSLFLVNADFDPTKRDHYVLRGVRARVADGLYSAELVSYAEDNLPHETSLHGEHDPARDGLIDHFLKKLKA